MAYVSLAQSAEDRRRTDRKSGANASAVISVDPSGQVTLRLCSTPNGQGHATVAAQIVADALGLDPNDIEVVTEIDTLTSAWSIASGNYSNRFAAIVVDAIAKSAEQVADKVKLLAAEALDVSADEIELRDGYARVRGGSNKGLPFRKAAARAHWDPAGLPEGVAPGIHETAVVSPGVLGSPDEEDRIASAATFGFVVDLAAVEIDRKTGAIRIDKYASVHDVGTQLNPKVVEGQVHGRVRPGSGRARRRDPRKERRVHLGWGRQGVPTDRARRDVPSCLEHCRAGAVPEACHLRAGKVRDGSRLRVGNGV